MTTETPVTITPSEAFAAIKDDAAAYEDELAKVRAAAEVTALTGRPVRRARKASSTKKAAAKAALLADVGMTLAEPIKAARATKAPAKAAPADLWAAPVWATTKGLEVGDQVAKGQPKAEPLSSEFATVASVEMKDAGHKVITLEGGQVFGLGGVATKVWVRKPTVAAVSVRSALAAKPAASAAKGPRGRQAVAAGTKFTPSASFNGKAAERMGQEAEGKGVAGYVVRWPHATYDLLVRTAEAQGEGSHWLVRCNAHGATTPAANAKAGDTLGRKEALASWCPGHAAS